MRGFEIEDITEMHDITILDISVFSYTEHKPPFYINRMLYFRKENVDYIDKIIRVFESHPQVYVTRRVYNEIRKSYLGLKRNNFIYKKQADALARKIDFLMKIIREGHILFFPEEEIEEFSRLREYAWEKLLNMACWMGFSQTDFDLMLSSLLCSKSIGVTALVTDDKKLGRSCLILLRL